MGWVYSAGVQDPKMEVPVEIIKAIRVGGTS